MENILEAFDADDAQRITETLHRLAAHLLPEEYAIVGGLAIRYYVMESGQEYPKRQFNDLDIVVRQQSSVLPSISEDFKIAHYHEDGDDLYWAVVDPETGIKVDLFTWLSPAPNIDMKPIGAREFPMQSAEDQLAKTIYDITKVLHGGMVDPKQFRDAKMLLNIADTAVANTIFKLLCKGALPSIFEALSASEVTAKEQPELVSDNPHPKPKDNVCAECTVGTIYPLTTLDEIYTLVK